MTLGDGEKEERREEEVWHLGLNTGRDGGEWSHQHKSFMGWGVEARGARRSAVCVVVVLLLPFRVRGPERCSEAGKRREANEATPG